MGDTLRIATGLVEALTARAAVSRDEVCGLLLGDGNEVAALACRNVSPSPRDSFEIDPAALIAAHRAARQSGPAIIGCWHSHPSGDATPSVRDAAAAPPDGAIWLIVAGGTVAAWRATRDGAVHGRFNPVALELSPPCARVAQPSQARPENGERRA